MLLLEHKCSFKTSFIVNESESRTTAETKLNITKEFLYILLSLLINCNYGV